jgi:hypothetical protein
VFVRGGITKEFYAQWNEAHELYMKGDWLAAKPSLEKVHRTRGSIDQPTQILLSIMKGRTYCPPRGWCGVREIEEGDL